MSLQAIVHRHCREPTPTVPGDLPTYSSLVSIPSPSFTTRVIRTWTPPALPVAEETARVPGKPQRSRSPRPHRRSEAWRRVQAWLGWVRLLRNVRAGVRAFVWERVRYAFLLIDNLLASLRHLPRRAPRGRLSRGTTYDQLLVGTLEDFDQAAVESWDAAYSRGDIEFERGFSLEPRRT